MSSDTEHVRNLQSLIATRSLIAVLIGMGAYTLIEYLIDRPEHLSNFLTHHLLHVSVIGAAVWLASALLIGRQVIRPVNQIFLHLHKIASGRLDYLDMEVETTFLKGTVACINELVTRLRRTPGKDATSHALGHVRKLRSTLRGNLQCSETEFVEVMKLLTKLEGNLQEVAQTHDAHQTDST